MIYGNFQLVLLDDQTDRIGIRTMVLKQSCDPTLPNPDFPQKFNGLVLVGTQRRKNAGLHYVAATYEGANTNSDGGVEFKDRTNSTDYDFSGGFAEVSLNVIPNYFQLLEDFQGVPDVDGGDILWPPVLEVAGGGSGSFADGKQGKRNPLFGYQSYFRMEGNYRFRYATQKLPKDFLTSVGFIAKTLPGGPPPLPDGRNWLTASPDFSHRGNIYDVTENYWASGPGGWPLPIYQNKNGQSGSAGSPIGSGLDTGTSIGNALNTGGSTVAPGSGFNFF